MAHQVLGHPWPTIDFHSNIQAQVRVLHDKCRACARAHTHTHVRASVYVHLPPLVHPSPIRSGSNCISACCLAPYSLLLTASMRRSFGERHGGGEARCHVRRALLAAAVGERCPVPAELALAFARGGASAHLTSRRALWREKSDLRCSDVNSLPLSSSHAHTHNHLSQHDTHRESRTSLIGLTAYCVTRSSLLRRVLHGSRYQGALRWVDDMLHMTYGKAPARGPPIHRYAPRGTC